ncbi:hypothetical protein, partial [Duncaniella muris]|uniref:hypothetical protein n=1 Tax=Duncaniella muris TaxID=2094150 RepID=UPI00267676E8
NIFCESACLLHGQDTLCLVGNGTGAWFASASLFFSAGLYTFVVERPLKFVVQNLEIMALNCNFVD